MSLTPDLGPDRVPTETQPEPQPSRRSNRFLRVSFAIFAFEIGLFLLVFPWVDYWHLNYFPDLSPVLEDVWEDPFFRGAISGLGLVNIYVAGLEIVRMLRGAKPRP
jgi:hypothetical protein